MYLHIFHGSPKNNTPFCIETNIEYTIKYWLEQKKRQPLIQWVLSSSPMLPSYTLG